MARCSTRRRLTARKMKETSPMAFATPYLTCPRRTTEKSKRFMSNSARKLALTSSLTIRSVLISHPSSFSVVQQSPSRTMVFTKTSCTTLQPTMATRTTTAFSGAASSRTKRFSTRFRTCLMKTSYRLTRSTTWKTSMRIICSQKCSPSRINM